MYGSADRDESVFDSPDVFDVTRRPGDHIAFGLGPHFCLEACLARVATAEWADDEGPRILRNAFVRGVTEFPVTLTPR
ncbi:hypothetical protein [Actinomadura bangladeshensis]|uniref:Cytochrome P450 n=1 Tax=Actinomadura bangladeshensis TaxID=453573 RepID=A0A6L9QQP9_9ACTN|nr:hypothetical protein [Actinomadura bangladeshensis]NEA27416.1 hypothetical protein [Actinomadura bangladeshensis]